MPTIQVRVLQVFSDGSVTFIAPEGTIVQHDALPVGLVGPNIKAGYLADLVIDGAGAPVSLTSAVTVIAGSGAIQVGSQSQSIPALSTANVVVTWPVPWASAAYVAVAILEAIASILGVTVVTGVTAQTAASVTVGVQNTSISAKVVVVNVIGVLN